MKRAAIIYENEFGIAYHLPTPNSSNTAAQLVFRDLGFYLTLDELKNFSCHAANGLEKMKCVDCPHHNNCRSSLLRTPSSKMDMAISHNELLFLRELLDETILRIETKDYLRFAFN
ncbi:hypothetical protein [Flavimarina sp. Hel_I_48]|uniref:hypothetical protein n=1 Tax=Flavimarina sp. Hel_I_48 TaxID=1392488 RepID=UPI0004DF9DC5|nr:hypothetical protein [Flavimarina sp. Hel_I_48]